MILRTVGVVLAALLIEFTILVFAFLLAVGLVKMIISIVPTLPAIIIFICSMTLFHLLGKEYFCHLTLKLVK